ncbi:HXXXD-type acyl-transferase family protein [Striga asiatica]|uniref:HXXXD-type acyl-transferase family protein n=1 Tax=Striga asiatica TaxID=4170 RepID=A0A5A7QRF7_STRAF|nr:HXXXD-type acyl-transferase family protein [Striga asiatica]
MRWAHVLGDAYSAAECINTWGKIMANHKVPVHLSNPINIQSQPSTSASLCRSIKQLDPLGDNWSIPNNSKIMQTHTFHITKESLIKLLPEEKNSNKYRVITPFEVISAVIWKCAAKIMNMINIITVCKKSDKILDLTSVQSELPSNTRQVTGTVEARTLDLIRDADYLELAKYISEEFVDETNAVEREMEEGSGKLDFIVYGSNLTFVEWEEVNVWGLELNGLGPIFAGLSIDGVGDEGAVVVMARNGGGRSVNVILAEDRLGQLRNELVEYGIV